MVNNNPAPDNRIEYTLHTIGKVLQRQNLTYNMFICIFKDDMDHEQWSAMIDGLRIALGYDNYYQAVKVREYSLEIYLDRINL